MTNPLEALPNNPLLRLPTFENSSLSLRFPVIVGTFAIVSLFIVLGLWSTMAPLASATLAIGTVVVESNRKVVQHLEGGIVRAVAVDDGDHVMMGDLLIQLDQTRSVSTLQTLKPLLAINITQRARLEAERSSAEFIAYPASQDGLTLREFQSIEDDQTKNFVARRLALGNHIRTLESERRQLDVTMIGYEQQIQINELRLGLVTKDLNAAMDLASHGFGTQQHVRDVSKAVAELQGERATFLTRIAETELKIEHNTLDVGRVKVSFIEGVEVEIQQNDHDHFDLLGRYGDALDQLQRTRIEAPVAGRIVGLNVHTIGGVIGPGMALLDIVPDNDRLIIEAQIRPVDVEAVAPGQSVRVRVSGNDARHLPFLIGTVLSVSADRIQDRQRVSSYFLVRIGLNRDLTKASRQDDLRPGMGVEIMISKGEKAVIEYLVSPLMTFFANAMHE